MLYLLPSVLLIWDVYPGSEFFQLGSRIRNPNPGVNKAPDPGSGRATLITVPVWHLLVTSYIYYCLPVGQGAECWAGSLAERRGGAREGGERGTGRLWGAGPEASVGRLEGRSPTRRGQSEKYGLIIIKIILEIVIFFFVMLKMLWAKAQGLHCDLWNFCSCFFITS